ncbi:uncharacterized protein EI97DRAFT_432948 [Westerdykella ornata]|uniref:Uncharacterized protein n=1 Tax=Westerdykella ornata TaxID=318751 RepID=A0A6A6JJ85_WESOR|nr:uncharacterized protein EI97DRAFT_432948 [Westerdykella ornata]KAF2276700.1 hypothetical protein EI97DRAFT_432948 [Westerdykella ornata]
MDVQYSAAVSATRDTIRTRLSYNNTQQNQHTSNIPLPYNIHPSPIPESVYPISLTHLHPLHPHHHHHPITSILTRNPVGLWRGSGQAVRLQREG